jgi:signal transduction histidine kinase
MKNMFTDRVQPAALRPQELEAVYAISRAVAQATAIDPALDEIIRLTRSVFIFDNMVIYMGADNGILEPVYARVVGRGRSAEADLAWGEATAQDTYRTVQTTMDHEELDGWQEDRLALRDFLGLPLRTGEGLMGALVFGRFGGPDFISDQILLAEFIASHVAQLLDRRKLVGHVATLEAEQKLTQLQSDFIATVTHELCTPLGFIKGYATTLLREDTTWDESVRREFLTIIDEEADRLRELIDSLLDSSRLQAGTLQMQFQNLRLDTFLRDIAMRARTRHGSVNLAVKLDTQGIVVKADSTRLAQVFDNLLVNAVKYAPGAKITVTLDTVDNRAHVTVRDTGPGIPPEHMERLFQRFYRVPGISASVRGTGLGLYICRQLVNAHNGEITVESKVGEGTVFHIYLPIQQSHPEISKTQEIIQ